MYQRVIPRDLFNEAKLLKCLGQLALFIHNGKDAKCTPTPEKLTIEHENDENPEFKIRQLPELAGLTCSNLNIFYDNEYLTLYTNYNSKESYPLLYFTDDGEEIEVFDENGQFHPDFIESLTGTPE